MRQQCWDRKQVHRRGSLNISQERRCEITYAENWGWTINDLTGLHCSVPSGAYRLWSPPTTRKWLTLKLRIWVRWAQRPLVTTLSASTRLPSHARYQKLSLESYAWMDTWWGYAWGGVTLPPATLANPCWQFPGMTPHSADACPCNPWSTVTNKSNEYESNWALELSSLKWNSRTPRRNKAERDFRTWEKSEEEVQLHFEIRGLAKLVQTAETVRKDV